MNNLGFSNDNLHIGDVRVKGQDETIIIGNENGGNGYILPTEKGTEGQVITMNADNSTSFQDAPIPPGITGRIVKNLFVMRERTSFYNTLPTSAQALFQTGYGSNDVLIGDFPVNSTIHIYSRGVISFDASVVASGTGVFQLEIDDGAGNVVYFTSNNLTLSKQGTANQNRFYHLDFIFQRTGDNTYKLNGYGLASDGSNGQIKMGFVETSYTPVTPYTQFTIKATYYKIVSTPGEEYIPLAQVYINDLILDTSLLISPPPAPTSHTALTDLTAGDAGHTQFPLLQGRPLGQTISGGITPSEFLTLKSHTAGTNNIVIKDLNTTFEKNIDMNQNLIENCSGVINPTATTGIAGTSSSIGESTTDMSMIFQSNQASIQQLANQIIRFEPTVITASKDINIGTNQILDGVNNIIDFVGGDMTLLNTSLTNRIVVASQNDIDILANNQIKLGVPNASSNVVITSTDTSINQDLNMNDNEILQCNNIRTNTSPIFTINKNGSNATEIYGNSTIRRVQVSNAVYLLTGTNLECGTNDINDAGNVNISGSDNITIPVVVGTPSGALQVQNGGAYIKQDLQVDGSIYCDSINNIRPSGGLYSESSGFNIPSTNLTETNLLGQGGSSGTLAIPANTFSQFDSYSFKASGVLSGGSNDTATLRLKSLVNGTTPVELGSIVIQLTDNGLVDVAWKVEADFNVRTLGGAGVGVLVLSGNFAYTNNNDVLKTYLRTIINNTVFDTTQSNELQFTYQNDGTNPLTNIRIDQASFTKWY